MKHLRIFLLMTIVSLFSVSAYAQYAVYHSYEEEQAAKNSPEEIVYAYTKSQGDWVRMSLKIKRTDRSVLIVGYKPKDTSGYGESSWRTCNSWAEEISISTDGKEIYNKFDKKVYISALAKYVYF